MKTSPAVFVISSLLSFWSAGMLSAQPATVIVADAGSTGTQFWKVDFESGGGNCSGVKTAKLGTKVKPGLAGTPNEVINLLDGAASQLPDILTNKLEIRIIGTGGFRNLDAGDAKECRSACKQKARAIQQRIDGSGKYRARIHVASGEEEGRWSWLSVGIRNTIMNHATLEIGGATMQLAYRGSGGFTSKMAATGAVTTFKNTAPACTMGMPNSYADCRKAVAAYIQKNSDAQDLLSSDLPPSATVFGLGGVFNHLSSDMSRAVLNNDVSLLENLVADECQNPPVGSPEETCAARTLTVLLLNKIHVSQIHVRRIADETFALGAAFARNNQMPDSQCPNFAKVSLLKQ